MSYQLSKNWDWSRYHSSTPKFYLDGIVRHAQIRINPVEAVLELWMSKKEIFARSGWTVFGANGLLHLLQFNAHIIDVSVDGYQVYVLVLFKKGEISKIYIHTAFFIYQYSFEFLIFYLLWPRTRALISANFSFTFATKWFIFLEKNLRRNYG